MTTRTPTAPAAKARVPVAARDAPAAEESPANAAPQASEVRRDAHYPPDATVDVAEWLKAHGVTSKLHEKRCWDAGDRVGVPAQPGLVCLSTTHRPERTLATLHRVDGASVAMVWQGVVGTYANWLELTPLLALDGSRLDVHDSQQGACEGALEEYRAKQESGVRADFGDVLGEGCRTRGTYVFHEGRYVRDPQR